MKGSLPPRGPERWRALASKLSICCSQEEVCALLEGLFSRPGVTTLSFLNAHGANLAWTNDEFFQALNHSDVVVRDGIGIRVLLMHLGLEPGINLNGTDLIPRLLRAAPPGVQIALWGTRGPYLERAASALRHLSHAISIADGFQQPEYYVDLLAQQAPGVIVLGMGMPKQEIMARLLSEKSQSRTLLIVSGGAIIDFLGGRFPRAPMWLRSAGMEWAYRLLKEPRRLWRRYILGNALFLGRVLQT